MKKVSTIIGSLCLLLALLGCNKTSLIEGVSTNGTEVIINKTIFLNANGITPITFTIGTIPANFQIRTIASKGLATTTAYNSTDSVRYTDVFISQSGSFANSNNCISKFLYGNDLATANYGTASPLYLMVAKKSVPYTAAYSAITSSFAYNSYLLHPKFSVADDAYIAFRYLAAVNGANITYHFGWVHIIFAQDKLTINKIVYRTGSPLKAGYSKD